MVVVNDSAVRANRNVDSRFFVVFVAGFGNLDCGGGLAAADAFLLAGDADGAAADSDFNKVSARFGQEPKAFRVDNVSGADLYVLAKIFVDVLKRAALPFGKAFR